MFHLSNNPVDIFPALDLIVPVTLYFPMLSMFLTMNRGLRILNQCLLQPKTGQNPVQLWYEIIGDQTLAEAILDRIVHDAHRIELQGDSLRKKRKMEDQKV